jgi:hypothetical protein
VGRTTTFRCSCNLSYFWCYQDCAIRCSGCTTATVCKRGSVYSSLYDVYLWWVHQELHQVFVGRTGGLPRACALRRLNITCLSCIIYLWLRTRIALVQFVCLTTRLKPLPNQAVHIVRSRASSFRWEYPLLSIRSYSSFLRLLSRLPVTFIPQFNWECIGRL